MVTLLIYADESADAARHVFAVSGVVGTESEWQPAEAKWTDLLAGEEFHAAAWETEYADHSDRSKHQARLARYRDLTQLLCRSGLVGLSVALDVRRYRELSPNAPAWVPYFMCLGQLLRRCTECASRLRDSEGAEVKLDFTLDQHGENQGNASRLFELLKDQLATAAFNPLRELAFSSRANARIQVADLVAREAMKEAARVTGYTTRRMRRSFQALNDTGRFKFEVRPAELALQVRAQEGEWLNGYAAWLRERGRVMPNGDSQIA